MSNGDFALQEVCAGVLPLLEAFQAGGLELRLHQDPFHTPYIKLMGMLVIVVKLQFQTPGFSAPGPPSHHLVTCYDTSAA